MNKLAQLVREIVDAHLNEMARPSFGIKILDPEKADKVKKLYAGHWIAKMIDAIEKAGEEGITRGGVKNPETKQYEGGLSQLLDIDPMKLNSQLQALSDNGVISRGSPEKAPKPEKTGQRGRKSSDKSRAGIVRTLIQNFKDNPDFEPSEDDITYNLSKGAGTEKLSTNDIEKIKNSALGTSKRGPKPKVKDDLGGVKAAMKESLSEQFLRMHKLSGLS